MSSINTNILDDNSESQINNASWITKAVLLSLGITVYLFLVEFFRDKLPDTLFEIGPIEIRFSTLSFLFVLFVNSIYTPYFLNRIQPSLTIFKVVCISGILYFSAIVFKVFIYNFFVHGTGIQMNYGYIFYTSGIIALIGVCASNIRIRKLRGRKTIYAWLILFAVWYAFSVLAKM
jgi:hypothetical protein